MSEEENHEAIVQRDIYRERIARAEQSPPCDNHREDRVTTTERLERRYHVEKLKDTAGKHTGCRFFVLDPQHDASAVPALRAYADAVGGGLASDIRAWLRSLGYCPRCSQVRGHRGVCG